MNLSEINSACIKIIYDNLIVGYDGYHLGCKIYSKLTSDNDEDHNCIGCQFMNSHSTIYDNFSVLNTSNLSEEFYFKTYIFWMYQNVERIYEIFDIVNPGLKNPHLTQFFNRNFVTTKLIKRWMNFIKHPKAFQLTHHPVFTFEEEMGDLEEVVKLSSDEIEYFYKGDSKNRELTQLISNKSNIVVVMPDLIKITDEFCREFQIFSDFICNNDFVADILMSRSTIAKHFYEEE